MTLSHISRLRFIWKFYAQRVCVSPFMFNYDWLFKIASATASGCDDEKDFCLSDKRIECWPFVSLILTFLILYAGNFLNNFVIFCGRIFFLFFHMMHTFSLYVADVYVENSWLFVSLFLFENNKRMKKKIKTQIVDFPPRFLLPSHMIFFNALQWV